MPSWLTFNATTWVFSGTAGKLNMIKTITVTATESPGGASASTTFVLEVVYDDSPPPPPLEEFMAVPLSSSTPAKQKFALSNSSTTHTAAQSGLDTPGQSAQTVAPAEALSQNGTGELTPPQTQTTWYTYDAENRVQVVQGKLENGQIVLSDDIHSSYEQRYDAVGNATRRSTARASMARSRPRSVSMTCAATRLRTGPLSA